MWQCTSYVESNIRARPEPANFFFLLFADADSSRYTFSLYDEATFDANLLLSGGQQHTQMWGAEICLQGTASYDINILQVLHLVWESVHMYMHGFDFILQDFSYNLTAYHHGRLTGVVDMLAQSFNEAYMLITASESAYSAAVDRLLAAMDSIPLRFSPILDSLDRYRSESAGLRMSELKETADEIYRLLNVTYSTGNDIITSSLPVS